MWDRLDDWKTHGEGQAIADAMSRLTLYDELAPDISRLAVRLVEKARAISPADDNLVETFLRKKELASIEGRALLRLCEALERTSDKTDRATLLREQLDRGDWKDLLNAGVGSPERDVGMVGVENKLSALSGHFVMAESIEEAIRRADGSSWLGSFCVPGEGARSDADAARYEKAYAHCIDAITRDRARAVETSHGVSAKLSHWARDTRRRTPLTFGKGSIRG